MSLKEKIIQELQSEPKSMYELQKATDKSYKNIQARISELRRDGYTISQKIVKVQKYVLEEKSNALKIIDFIEKNNLYRTNISINNLSKELSISADEVKSAISKLFTKCNIIQFDSDTIKFL